MRNPFKRQEKALNADAAVLDALRDRAWTPYPMLGGGSRQRILDAFNTAQSANYAWIYTNSPAVRTVIDVLVRNIGQLDLRLYEEISESERQSRPEHPAAISLRYPSETVTSDGFVRSLFKDFLVFDNAYALLMPAAGNQVTLTWIPAHMVEILGSSLFRADGYRVHRSDGTFVDFQPDQILHWHGENPHDPRIGLSRLDTLRSVTAEDAALQQAIVELANSGLTEPMYVYRPLEAPVMSNPARDGLEEDLANRMRRANRKPFVLEEGSELRGVGVSPKDAQMMEVRKWAIQRVAAEYGVPLGMVGLSENLKDAQSLFYSDTLPPYCQDFTKMLNQRILVRVYGWTDGCFEFNLDEKHMGDDRLTALVSATGRPVLVTNEARAMVNKPPVEGGDELVTPLNVIVGENPQPSVDVVNPADPNGQPRGVGYDQEPKALVKATENQPVPQFSPTRKADLERQHRAIDKSQAVIERHFNRLERSLRNAKAVTDWSRWDREFADDVNKLVEDIVESEGTIYAFKLGGAFDMRRVQNYLQAMAEGAAEGINAKIREEIDAFGLDETVGRKTQHVASAGAGLGAGAVRWAREEAARQSPGTEQRVKVWIPDTDRHAEFAGDTVALGAPWPAGFAPGSAPGCKCTMAIQ